MAGAQRLFGYGEVEARVRTLPELIVSPISIIRPALPFIIAARESDRTALLKETVRRHKDVVYSGGDQQSHRFSMLGQGFTGLIRYLPRFGGRHAPRTAPAPTAERQAFAARVRLNLIRASEPSELGAHDVRAHHSALGAVVCTNYPPRPTGHSSCLFLARHNTPEQPGGCPLARARSRVVSELPRQAASRLWPRQAAHRVRSECGPCARKKKKKTNKKKLVATALLLPAQGGPEWSPGWVRLQLPRRHGELHR